MRKRVIPVFMALTMAALLSACSGKPAGNTEAASTAPASQTIPSEAAVSETEKATETTIEETTAEETAAAENGKAAENSELSALKMESASKTANDETGTVSKSSHLLAKGYEVMDGITVPVGISNEDLGSEGLEPKNAEKLTIDTETIQGTGKLDMYIFRPAGYKEGEITPLIYFIHGGGYHFGNVSADEGRIHGIADASGATVVSPEYTLSLDPSYKYPVELEEVYTGLHYVYEHANDLSVDPDNIVIEGESAGGGLTARLALYNRDKGEVPLKGQVLIYPMLDYRTGGEEDIYNNEYVGEFVWTKENNVFGWGKLVEGQDTKISDEEMIYFSPATAAVDQLKGLPETFLIVGSLDLFCDEDMDYAQKLMEAGVFTELYVEPGVPHAYEYLDGTPQAERFYELRNNATLRMLEKESANAGA